jgi:hypothetical protein
MKLSEWLEQEGLTLRAAEKRFRRKLTFGAIAHLANGTRNPEWETLLLILHTTKGQVTPNDFVKKWPKGAKA